jgi:glycine betaine catabolism A
MSGVAMRPQVIEAAYQQLCARRADWSLDQSFYVDADIFDLEMELFFGRQWLFAAMECEIPTPGDWIRVDIGRESVVIIRRPDGAVRAFYNTCRHRGSRICVAERGHQQRLVCPYHQWTYDSNGQLVGARLMGADFDKSAFQLSPVSVGLLGGYIFINLAADPASFADMRRAVESYLLPHQLNNAKVAHTQTLVERANWKLVIENNRECYHCVVSHPELMHTITEIDDPNDPLIEPGYRALIQSKSAEWDRLGLPSAHTQGSERYRAVRLPFSGGRVSMTPDGRPGCTRLLGDLQDADLGSVRFLSLPNSWNHVLADHAVTFRVLPVGPEETLVTTKWLVHKDAQEGVHYSVDRLAAVWSATNEQDKRLAENNQLGIRSRAYRPGPYSELIEGGTRGFVRWYVNDMKSALARLVHSRAGSEGAAA